MISGLLAEQIRKGPVSLLYAIGIGITLIALGRMIRGTS